MHSRHRRAPSAMPCLGFEDESPESTNYLTPAMQVSLPRFQLPKPSEENILKNSSKPTAASYSSQKFSHNYSNSLFSELYHDEEESGNGSVKEISECNEISSLIEMHSDEPSENPLSELKEAMEIIVVARSAKENKLEMVKKSLKAQLSQMFKQEVSDLDTDRRKDSVKCSEDTIEGPGSSFNMEDFSLVKFEVSVDKPEKKKPKKVKFKDL